MCSHDAFFNVKITNIVNEIDTSDENSHFVSHTDSVKRRLKHAKRMLENEPLNIYIPIRSLYR